MIHSAFSRCSAATLCVLALTAAGVIVAGGPAVAAVVPTVPMATAANYAVLGAQTVTNTGDSVLDGSLGLWPGTSITGFPPGLVLPPGTTDTTNAAAQQAQTDLTAAYVNAASRPVNGTTTEDLADLSLQAGVYSGPSKSPLSLTGPLVLDGAGDPTSVFIFQTDSTLTTGSGSTVTLINGAQACNVFWQVGSSATLGTGSVFTGNILALASITVTNSVTVRGRALARTAAVTLDNDTFTTTACAQTTPDSDLDVSTSVPSATATPDLTGTPSPAVGSPALSGSPTSGGSPGPSAPGAPGSGTPGSRTPSSGIPGAPGVPGVVGPPRTGGTPLIADGLSRMAGLVAGVAAAAAVGVVTAGQLASQRRRTGSAPV